MILISWIIISWIGASGFAILTRKMDSLQLLLWCHGTFSCFCPMRLDKRVLVQASVSICYGIFKSNYRLLHAHPPPPPRASPPLPYHASRCNRLIKLAANFSPTTTIQNLVPFFITASVEAQDNEIFGPCKLITFIAIFRCGPQCHQSTSLWLMSASQPSTLAWWHQPQQPSKAA